MKEQTTTSIPFPSSHNMPVVINFFFLFLHQSFQVLFSCNGVPWWHQISSANVIRFYFPVRKKKLLIFYHETALDEKIILTFFLHCTKSFSISISIYLQSSRFLYSQPTVCIKNKNPQRNSLLILQFLWVCLVTPMWWLYDKDDDQAERKMNWEIAIIKLMHKRIFSKFSIKFLWWILFHCESFFIFLLIKIIY